MGSLTMDFGATRISCTTTVLRAGRFVAGFFLRCTVIPTLHLGTTGGTHQHEIRLDDTDGDALSDPGEVVILMEESCGSGE